MPNPSFPNMSDEEVADFLSSQGCQDFRKLPDGEWIALMPLAFTLSICCAPDECSAFKYRWCFEDPAEAHYFFENCQEFDEIPVRRTSLKGHRYLDKPLYVEYDQFGHAKW